MRIPAAEERARRPLFQVRHRGYLPHWDAEATPQSLTLRLHDSLPTQILASIETELAQLPRDRQASERRKHLERLLDAGHGASWLARPNVAAIVEEALLHFDRERYSLHAWVVMPNHVHAVLTPRLDVDLSSVLHSWKSFTSKEVNRVLGRQGPFWQKEYFDRLIWSEEHFRRAIEYVELNPVKAGLCSEAGHWRFGSAWSRRPS